MALNRQLYTLLTKHVQEFAKRKAHDLCLASHGARFPSRCWKRFSLLSDLDKITFWLGRIPRTSKDCDLSKLPSEVPLVHLRRKR